VRAGKIEKRSKAEEIFSSPGQATAGSDIARIAEHSAEGVVK